MSEAKEIREILRRKPDGRLFHREGQELEFKEQFNFAGLPEYLRDFVAFANNRGGHLVFGVTDKPRLPKGLSDKALEQFERIDPERITGFLLELFAPVPEWEQEIFEIYGLRFGVFRIWECQEKPIIARRDEGKDNIIKNGEIYYRYGGRTQKIQFGELASLIRQRVERNNREWMDLVSKIGESGPEHAAILDTERSLIQKGSNQILVVEEKLARKLRFIKEGQFRERQGDPTLKLVGDVSPVEHVDVVKHVSENLTGRYPLSAMELAEAVRAAHPGAKQNKIWEAIRDNDLKNNSDYAVYNFRNKKQEDEYAATGQVPAGTPSIYRRDAVDFLVNVLKGAPPED